MKMHNKLHPCDNCRHPEFEVSSNPWSKRPSFKCTGCGHEWSCGIDGGKWLKYAVPCKIKRINVK